MGFCVAISHQMLMDVYDLFLELAVILRQSISYQNSKRTSQSWVQNRSKSDLLLKEEYILCTYV